MSDLRRTLENALRQLPDVTVDLWHDSHLMCVFYRGKEIAHFHDHEEIDIRMSRPFIKKEGLIPLEDSPYHPKRSRQSRWLQIRFQTEEECGNLLQLM